MFNLPAVRDRFTILLFLEDCPQLHIAAVRDRFAIVLFLRIFLCSI
jgi:hypothetical protein